MDSTSVGSLAVEVFLQTKKDEELFPSPRGGAKEMPAGREDGIDKNKLRVMAIGKDFRLTGKYEGKAGRGTIEKCYWAGLITTLGKGGC